MIFITFMTAIYSFIFIFTSEHVEFLGLLSNNETLNSAFWNGWSNFIKTGKMKFIGYLIISLTIAILILVILKRTKKYDEYQISMLSKSLIVAGILSILLLPMIMILLLSDPNYSVETILLLSTVQWVSVLVSYLTYVIKF